MLKRLVGLAPSAVIVCAGASQRELIERGVRELHWIVAAFSDRRPRPWRAARARWSRSPSTARRETSRSRCSVVHRLRRSFLGRCSNRRAQADEAPRRTDASATRREFGDVAASPCAGGGQESRRRSFRPLENADDLLRRARRLGGRAGSNRRAPSPAGLARRRNDCLAVVECCRSSRSRQRDDALIGRPWQRR